MNTPGAGRLSRDGYRRGVDAFRAFATASRHAHQWSRLVELAEVDAGLPDTDVVVPATAGAATGTELQRDLMRRGRERAADAVLAPLAGAALARRMADEFVEHRRGAGDEPRRALDVLLVRALDPLAGLLTCPPETLFNGAETALLGSRARTGRGPHEPEFSWRPGRDVEYGGYVCAIVKFTRLCNLRCTYCADWRAGPGQTMPFEVQARLFEELLGSGSHAIVDVVWHGGEPTLLGTRGFLRILYLQAFFRSPGQTLHNVVQTNAVAVDERWARFLACFGFRAGVSLDGAADVHDAARPDVRGQGTVEKTGRGLELLRRHGVLGHVLVVVGERTLAWGAEALLEFLQARGVTRAALLAVRPDLRLAADDGLYLDPERYTRFLVEFDRARRRRPEPWVGVREIDALLEALRGRPGDHCETAGQCVGAFFSIDPDGAVRHCDKFGALPEYHLGNVLDSGFDVLRGLAKTRTLAAQAQAETRGYEGCPYFHYCRGWCPHERFVARRRGRPLETCCGLAPLFEGLQANMLAPRAGVEARP